MTSLRWTFLVARVRHATALNAYNHDNTDATHPCPRVDGYQPMQDSTVFAVSFKLTMMSFLHRIRIEPVLSGLCWLGHTHQMNQYRGAAEVILNLAQPRQDMSAAEMTSDYSTASEEFRLSCWVLTRDLCTDSSYNMRSPNYQVGQLRVLNYGPIAPSYAKTSRSQVS